MLCLKKLLILVMLSHHQLSCYHCRNFSVLGTAGKGYTFFVLLCFSTLQQLCLGIDVWGPLSSSAALNQFYETVVNAIISESISPLKQRPLVLTTAVLVYLSTHSLWLLRFLLAKFHIHLSLSFSSACPGQDHLDSWAPGEMWCGRGVWSPLPAIL